MLKVAQKCFPPTWPSAAETGGLSTWQTCLFLPCQLSNTHNVRSVNQILYSQSWGEDQRHRATVTHHQSEEQPSDIPPGSYLLTRGAKMTVFLSIYEKNSIWIVSKSGYSRLKFNLLFDYYRSEHADGKRLKSSQHIEFHPGATQASVTHCNLSFINLSEEVNPGIYHQYSMIIEYPQYYSTCYCIVNPWWFYQSWTRIYIFA